MYVVDCEIECCVKSILMCCDVCIIRKESTVMPPKPLTLEWEEAPFPESGGALLKKDGKEWEDVKPTKDEQKAYEDMFIGQKLLDEWRVKYESATTGAGAMWRSYVPSQFKGKPYGPSGWLAEYEKASSENQRLADITRFYPLWSDTLKTAVATEKACGKESAERLALILDSALNEFALGMSNRMKTEEMTPFLAYVEVGKILYDLVFKKGWTKEGQKSLGLMISECSGIPITGGGGSGASAIGGASANANTGGDWSSALAAMMAGQCLRAGSICRGLRFTIPMLVISQFGENVSKQLLAYSALSGSRCFDYCEIADQTYEVFIDDTIDINTEIDTSSHTTQYNDAEFMIQKYAHYDMMKHVHDVMDVQGLDKDKTTSNVKEGYWMIKGMRIGITFLTSHGDTVEEPNEGYRFIMVNGHPEIQKAYQAMWPDTQDRSKTGWQVMDKLNMFSALNPLQKPRVLVDYANSLKNTHMIAMSTNAPIYFKRPGTGVFDGVHPITGIPNAAHRGGEGLHCVMMTNARHNGNTPVRVRVTGWVRITPSPFFGELMTQEIMDRYLMSRTPVTVSDKLETAFGAQFQAERPRPTTMAGFMGYGPVKSMTMGAAKSNTGVRKKSLASKSKCARKACMPKINERDMMMMAVMKSMEAKEEAKKKKQQ